MKVTKFLFLILALLTVQTINAQSCKVLPTTTDEYNYIVKGYKIQLESGLDMKKGYSLRNILQNSADGRSVVFKELIKDEKDLRAIMAIFTGKNGITTYLCIPLGNDTSFLAPYYTSAVISAIDNIVAMSFYQTELTKVLSYYIAK
jgi:hypothetical protein